MTPVLCESFNNNNNSLNSTGSSVSSCGKMSEYAEYPEYQKHAPSHYTDTEHGHPLYPYTEGHGGDVGDGGEGWSEGDECSVDGLGREVYSAVGGSYSGAYTPGGHTAYYDATIPMYESYQDSPTESYGSPSSNKKKGKGGRKKNLHPPTPTIMKHRRNMANARERKRMNGLNDAFERLREVVPNVNTEQKMSKIETLLVAQTYIKALAKLMDSVVAEEEEAHIHE